MSFWLRVEPSRPRHFKWANLTDAAYRFADEVLCWGAEQETSFVPELAMVKLAGTRGRAQKLCTELVNCGHAQGKAGILEPVDGGWVIHDAEQYWPPNRDEPSRPANDLAAKRAAAGRLGGLRSVETRIEAFGSARPKQIAKQPTKQPTKQTEANREALASEAKPPLSALSPLQNGNGNGNLAAAAAAKDLKDSPARARAREEQQRPRDLDSSLRFPIAERAKFCVEDPGLANYLSPEQWPEVVLVVEAFKRETAKPNLRIGSFARDKGIQKIVGLFADGLTPAELELAVERTVKSEWWRSGKRGLSDLSFEVVRRALDDEKPVTSVKYESEAERVACRNHLLTKAKNGEYGIAARFWEHHGLGESRGELADLLERREAVTEERMPEAIRELFGRWKSRPPKRTDPQRNGSPDATHVSEAIAKVLGAK